MRLWTLHPSHLGVKNLGGCWRETLLAQKVLAGECRGYRHHPQLVRFRAHPQPMQAIGYYLSEIQREAASRGYNYNASLIREPVVDPPPRIKVSRGQVDYENEHLAKKLKLEAPPAKPRVHPLFEVDDAATDTEPWEKVAAKKPRKL